MTLPPGLVVGVVSTASPDTSIWSPCDGGILPAPARPFIPSICTKDSSNNAVTINFYMTIVSDDCTLPPGAVIASTSSSPGSDWDACDGGSGRPLIPEALSPTNMSTIYLYFYTNNTTVTSFPTDSVMGWAGSLSSEPSGFAWCDGGSDPEVPGIEKTGAFNPQVRMVVKT